MATFSANIDTDSRFPLVFLEPQTLQGLADGNAVTVKESDHFQILANGSYLDIYGTDLTYTNNLITGGTLTGDSVDENGSRALTLANISATAAQLSAAGNDLDAMTQLIYGGDDAIQFSLTSDNNDVGLGGFGKDTIQGGPGKDLLLGNQGDDVILANQDDDEIYGGKDNDVVFAGKGADKATGNEGNDVVAGNEGNDTLHGGQGNDIIYGGQDADLIYGDVGNDTLYGNQGPDTFRFAQGDGADLVADFSKADGDKIDLQGLGYSVSQNAAGNAVLNVFGGGTIELAGIAAANVDPTVFTG